MEGAYVKPGGDAAQEWQDRYDFALLTIFKNCEDNVRSKIETSELASDAWKILKDGYEG